MIEIRNQGKLAVLTSWEILELLNKCILGIKTGHFLWKNSRKSITRKL